MKKRRKIVVEVATSADGFIARPDGDVAWLDRPQPKGNYGMGEFFKSIDTILWGRKTYSKGIEMGMEKGMPFGSGLKNYLFSRQRQESLIPGFEWVNEPCQGIRAATARAARQRHLDDGRRRNHRIVSRRRRDRRVQHPCHPGPHWRGNPLDPAPPSANSAEAAIEQSVSRRCSAPELPSAGSFEEGVKSAAPKGVQT